MGTRGAFGVVINKTEKIGYNQFDSYPDGRGVENLRWLRDADHSEVYRLAEEALLVDEEVKPTTEQIKSLAAVTNLGVSEQSTDDWYCLTHATHGDIGAMLECGFILDSHTFPLDSVFCEWGYVVDLDRLEFEVYEGFQKTFPKKGRWKGRPTKAEDEVSHKEHLEWCAANNRDPWKEKRSKYKAIALVASWPLNDLPTDEEFLMHFRLAQAEEAIANAKEYPNDATRWLVEIDNEGLDTEGRHRAEEWGAIRDRLLLVVTPSDVARLR